MSYDNKFSLKIPVVGYNSEDVKRCEHCDLDGRNYEVSENFCSNCGELLTLMQVKIPYEAKNLIKELRNNSEEAKSLLNLKGGVNCSGSGREIDADIQKFSKKYPETVFQLDATWDSGFGDAPTRYYIKNGKAQTCQATYKFEDYNELKLKDNKNIN